MPKKKKKKKKGKTSTKMRKRKRKIKKDMPKEKARVSALKEKNTCRIARNDSERMIYVG